MPAEVIEASIADVHVRKQELTAAGARLGGYGVADGSDKTRIRVAHTLAGAARTGIVRACDCMARKPVSGKINLGLPAPKHILVTHGNSPFQASHWATRTVSPTENHVDSVCGLSKTNAAPWQLHR